MPTIPLQLRQALIDYVLTLLQILLVSLVELAENRKLPRKDPIPYHTSILSGYQWVLELLSGHPDRIRCELGMEKEVFLQLVIELRQAGLHDSRQVTLEEQLAIFLYICVTGLTVRHVGERFQRSGDTISRYFRKILKVLSCPPFYTTYVQPPSDAIQLKIRRNPKFFPYFHNAIGAIDGSHIPVSPPAYHRPRYRNRKGFLSQNALFVCDFDLRFTYALTGWEGSASDARIYGDAIGSDLRIPAGKYLLADAGFPLCSKLLVPFRGVRYHLAEWGRGLKRPQNKEELFNLRHSSARNAVERIFGVLKRRFRILLLPTEYSIEIQAQIPSALCVIHNFISMHKTTEDDGTSDSDETDDDEGNNYTNATIDNFPAVDSDDRAGQMRDGIADAMWADYQQLLHEREAEERALDLSDNDSEDAESDAWIDDNA